MPHKPISPETYSGLDDHGPQTGSPCASLFVARLRATWLRTTFPTGAPLASNIDSTGADLAGFLPPRPPPEQGCTTPLVTPLPFAFDRLVAHCFSGGMSASESLTRDPEAPPLDNPHPSPAPR